MTGEIVEQTSELPADEAVRQAPVAVLTQVKKTYHLDSVEVPVIKGVDILVRQAKFTVLLGPSGSGKTTLLNMIGCIDRPDEGDVIVSECKVGELSDDALSDFRAKNIGFIFQNFNLLPVLSAYENVEYPLLLAGATASQRGKLVPRLLKAVGLGDRAKNLPGQLSGGQRQRVAIARALARKPKLIIADEPTANLDSQTGASILALMRRMVDEYQISFLFSSHDPEVIKAARSEDPVVGLAQPVAQPAPVFGDFVGHGNRVNFHIVVRWLQRQHQLQHAHPPCANRRPLADPAPRLLSVR
jgi:putative ABC transport system ATP-binding protein